MPSLSWPTWAEGLVIYAGSVLAWALGLFVVTRGGLRRIPLLAAAATLVLVVYQLGQALGALAPTTAVWLEWARRTWWAAALAPAIWLVLMASLAADEAPEDRRGGLRRLAWWSVPVASLAAVLFAVVGGTTTLVVDWATPSSPQGPPPSPRRTRPSSPGTAQPGARTSRVPIRSARLAEDWADLSLASAPAVTAAGQPAAARAPVRPGGRARSRRPGAGSRRHAAPRRARV